MVKALIVFGAELDPTNERGETPRHLAATSKEKNRYVQQLYHIS
jgi:hypothetical protein